MYFLIYHVRPLPELNNSEGIGGAYVSCWIEAGSLKQADSISRQEIGLANWEILERDEAYKIKSYDYSRESDGYEFYQQALIDKWVLRFHTYPIE